MATIRRPPRSSKQVDKKFGEPNSILFVKTSVTSESETNTSPCVFWRMWCHWVAIARALQCHFASKSFMKLDIIGRIIITLSRECRKTTYPVFWKSNLSDKAWAWKQKVLSACAKGLIFVDGPGVSMPRGVLLTNARLFCSPWNLGTWQRTGCGQAIRQGFSEELGERGALWKAVSVRKRGWRTGSRIGAHLAETDLPTVW